MVLAYWVNMFVINCGLYGLPIVALGIVLFFGWKQSQSRLVISLEGLITFSLINGGAMAVVNYYLGDRLRWHFLSIPLWIAAGSIFIRLLKKPDLITGFDVFLGALIGITVCIIFVYIVCLTSVLI